MARRKSGQPVPQEAEAEALTKIQRLLVDPDQVTKLIGPLNQFLGRPENENAVRLATIATTPKKSTERLYQKQEDEFKKLFPKSEIFPDKIRRWILDINKDNNLKAYLAILAIHRLQQGPHLYQEQILTSSPQITTTLNKIEKYLMLQNPKILTEGEIPTRIRTPVDALGMAVESATNSGTLLQVLFDRHVDTDGGDASYYAVYRWSTKANFVVKTFLAVLTPNAREMAIGQARMFSFTHVYPGPPGQKRIAQGGVMTSSQHISFIGASGRNTMTGWLTQGVKVIAVPTMPTARHGFWLLPGVFFSYALQWQPVVGRCALLHLGFRSRHNEIRDNHARIGEFPTSDLSADLRYMVENFEIEERHGFTPADIEAFLLNSMNNVPKVDRKTVGEGGLLRSLCIEDDEEPRD